MATKRVPTNLQRGNLAKEAQDIEVTIQVKKSQEARYNHDPVSLFINRFLGSQRDGVAINEAL